MIEFCSKRRLISAVIILVIFTVIILVVENGMSLQSDNREMRYYSTRYSSSNNTNGICREEDEVEEVESCRPCEPAKLEETVCKATAYVKKVVCKRNNDELLEVSKSCPKVRWTEEKSFWTLECGCALLGTLSFTVVKWRHKRLAQQLAEKVNRQLASGVWLLYCVMWLACLFAYLSYNWLIMFCSILFLWEMHYVDVL